MEVDRAASGPGFFAPAFGLVGMICGRFMGVADDRDFFWDLGMVEERWRKLYTTLRAIT